MVGQTAEVGHSRVELPIPYDGEPIEITLDHRFLGEFLRVLDHEKSFTLDVKDAEEAALCTTDDGYGYVINDNGDVTGVGNDDIYAQRVDSQGDTLWPGDAPICVLANAQTYPAIAADEDVAVSISHSGYIKRTAASTYRAQRRGGKGLKGAKTEEEDPIEHLFVASTHAYLLFFTNRGKVYWRKVYGLPQLGRHSRGRAIVNLLNLTQGEQITDCRAVMDFDRPDHFLVMATARGLDAELVLSDKAYTALLDSLGSARCRCHTDLDDELLQALFGPEVLRPQGARMRLCAAWPTRWASRPPRPGPPGRARPSASADRAPSRPGRPRRRPRRRWDDARAWPAP